MNQPSEMEQIEVSIDQAKEAVAMRDTYIRLLQNPDFDKIIHKGYFETESIRAVMAKSNPELQTPEHQAQIMRTIDAIGSLRQYFQKIVGIGNQMESSLREDEATREAILAEDME